MEYNAEENVSRGVDKTKMQYFTYEFLKSNYVQNIGKLVKKLGDGIDGADFKGISLAQ